jgi:DNA repair protein RecO (recombination protein O)
MSRNVILLQPAYILHTRAYRDTSLLLDIFSQEHGRISLVARGAKGLRSRFKGVLQAFCPLLISWQGKTELMTLTSAEFNGVAQSLQGGALICGLYLNELLVRLLHRYDPHPRLFQVYQETLAGLQACYVDSSHDLQRLLRLFEKRLLSELGYALQLDCEGQDHLKIKPEQYYYFDPINGLFSAVQTHGVDSTKHLFLGESLLALNVERLDEKNTLRDAKRLLRMALAQLLGSKPLRSRELFLR